MSANRSDRKAFKHTQLGGLIMWYFSWILGVGVALGFGIINAMWLESRTEKAPVKAKR